MSPPYFAAFLMSWAIVNIFEMSLIRLEYPEEFNRFSVRFIKAVRNCAAALAATFADATAGGIDNSVSRWPAHPAGSDVALAN